MCTRLARTDERDERHNQSPPRLPADMTTNEDLGGTANSRVMRGGGPRSPGFSPNASRDGIGDKSNHHEGRCGDADAEKLANDFGVVGLGGGLGPMVGTAAVLTNPKSVSPDGNPRAIPPSTLERIRRVFITYGKFMGPGFMISVAYIDPGNYSTDIAAAASYRFRLLFIVLLSNLFAILLQSLAIRLGTVTGLDLSSACRAFLPRWLNYVLYGRAEIAIIATDIAEVIGTATALNLLIPQLPLLAGCALSILDVLVILLFYNPSGKMRDVRLFELFVSCLVLGVVICFSIQLSLIKDTSVGDVFKGYLPSSAIVCV